MTYLNLVNNVLRRLRESEVTSVQDTAYSKLIGDIVNDAKDLVENAWDWSALRTTLTITTQANIFNYSLTGSQNSIKELNVLNDTSNSVMEYQTAKWFDAKFLLSSPETGSPQYFNYNGVDSDGDTLVDLYPKPDGVYSIRFNCVLRNADLSTDTDKLKIPSAPVIHLAVALAARERGETGGTSTQEYFNIANQYLSDAITQDAGRHPEEVVFYTP
jgi:hypothetical protein|tara:strand:+ start:291 stop:938 length:648 start_codon:yes stop_codon:yes gene_type:complete